MAPRAWLPAALAAALVVSANANLAALNAVSFLPPFVSMTPGTMLRGVSDDWAAFGDTEVFQSFARLTPTRANSFGALWSHSTLGSDAVSVVFKFRLSGKGDVGDRGEGLALWLATEPEGFTPGDSFGSTENFTGVALLFDTRSVVAKVVARTKAGDVLVAECSADVRRDARRGDYDFKNTSRARLIVDGSTAHVLLDVEDTGDWEHCAQMDLPADFASSQEEKETWLQKAKIGVTASSGTSADAHDVISLEAFGDVESHDWHLTSGWSKFLPGHGSADEDRLQRIDEMLNWITFKIDHLGHVLEHSSQSFAQKAHHATDGVSNHLADEDLALLGLEAQASGVVDEAFENRILSLQRRFDARFETRLGAADAGLGDRLADRLGQELVAFDNAWQQPFRILLAAHALLLLGLALGYRKLREI
ncbi:concanavalin A-like lectin/glucanase domain-containing protein [Pelagophyceae sp. CCMP2097]|nr:concanavalin A-like lectin/glucanase domain-containing protein [Pelagophyceae sp. CCMP2097]